MSIKTTLEYWNESPDPETIHVIIHPRNAFYNGKHIAWYEFSMDGIPLHELGHEDILPNGFLRMDDTDYYEFGGNKENAVKILTDAGFTLIINGNEL